MMSPRSLTFACLVVGATFCAHTTSFAQQPQLQQKQKQPNGKSTTPSSSPEILDLQIRLGRHLFSPGEIDGHAGANTSKALAAFAASHKLGSVSPGDPAVAEAMSDDSAPTTASYQVTGADVVGPFTPSIP